MEYVFLVMNRVKKEKIHVKVEPNTGKSTPVKKMTPIKTIFDNLPMETPIAEDVHRYSLEIGRSIEKNSENSKAKKRLSFSQGIEWEWWHVSAPSLRA